MTPSTAAPATPRHGGDLAFAASLYGTPSEGWLDLSTGINPVPYPAVLSDMAGLARLPDPAALAELLDSARAAYGIAEPAVLIATSGSEIAIRLLPVVAPPGPAAILVPIYGSHIEAWHLSGRKVTEIAALTQLPDDASVVVLASPNNPDGRIVRPDALAAFAQELGARGGILVVDEAFADVAPEISLARYLTDLPAVVLRSFGKFHGLAGLRLGFAAGHPSTLTRLAALLGDWPVSSAAIAIGGAALSDGSWRDATRARLRADAARLRVLLTRHGLSVAGGTDLFVLAGNDHASAIHEALAKRGIWTRAFADHRSWLRFGLPPGLEGFARLERALAAIMRPASPVRAE